MAELEGVVEAEAITDLCADLGKTAIDALTEEIAVYVEFIHLPHIYKLWDAWMHEQNPHVKEEEEMPEGA
jgi:hypothetical protein